MGDLPSFSAFYRSVHLREPFPWQVRLAERVVQHGWPSEIGVQTGLGKTSAIDIAVWSLAAQAGVPPAERTAATRIWYVVNRRLLVDTASEHCERLALLLAEPTLAHHGATAPSDTSIADSRSILAEVAARLQTIAGGTCTFALRDGREVVGPLYVSRMRGGAQVGSRPPHPAQPSVICTTVPMYGSRLMFRGYGSSNRTWPIDAAHAGTDSVVLLDEAHLAQPLERLIAMVDEVDGCRTGIMRLPGGYSGGPGPSLLLPPARAYPRLVSLTATGRESDDRFELDDADLGHSVVQQRLHASKPTRIVDCDHKELARTLVDELLGELGRVDEPVCAVVFVNTPRMARAVAHSLDSVKKGPELEAWMLTGQMRDVDADRVRAVLLDREVGAPAGRIRSHRSRHLVVIATQTLEVGADLDFDVLVTESAGVRAITQRFGRLNRLGNLPAAVGVICHPAGRPPGEAALYGAEPEQLVDRLRPMVRLDLSPAQIASVLGQPADKPGRIPELLPHHLWELVKTSVPPTGAAPAEVFFDGAPEQDRKVSVCWRAHLPCPNEALVPAPSAAEFVDVSIAELGQLLNRIDHHQALRITDDGAATEQLPKEPADRQRWARPGDRIVLDASAGGYQSDRGWDPESTATVRDLSPLLFHRLHLCEEALINLVGPATPPGMETGPRELADARPEPVDEMGDPDTEADADYAASVLEWLAAIPTPADVEDADWNFPHDRWEANRVGSEQSLLLSWDLRSTRSSAPSVDALDELSIIGSAGLADHLNEVGHAAAEIAIRLGLPAHLREAVLAAGRFHDVGKADDRFQQLLGAKPGEPPRAKSAMSSERWRIERRRSPWPSGGRHELLSRQLIATMDELDERAVVEHLVIAHHGHGRPSCPTTTPCTSLATSIELDQRVLTASTNPSVADWSQPDRFRQLCERFGYWGLALLECVVRQADHIVSARVRPGSAPEVEVQ